MDSKSTKQRKKLINFFHCFRPAAYEPCISNTNNHNHNHGALVDKADMLSEGDDVVSRKRSRGVLSRALRAVFFETSLVKKMRKMKSKKMQKSSMDKMRNQSLSCSSSNSSAPFSSSSLCSSCSSSSSSSDTSNRSFLSYKTASNPTHRQRNLGKNKVMESGWFLLMICLLSLILCGKVGGVVFTSAWIMFLIRPSFQIEFSSEEDEEKKKEIDDSGECKKRIVMEV